MKKLLCIIAMLGTCVLNGADALKTVSFYNKTGSTAYFYLKVRKGHGGLSLESGAARGRENNSAYVASTDKVEGAVIEIESKGKTSLFAFGNLTDDAYDVVISDGGELVLKSHE